MLVPLVAVGLELGPVELSGRVSVTSENIITPGAQADTVVEPRSRLACRLCPTVSLWGLPLSFDLQVGTVGRALSRSFDLLGLSLDPSLLRLRLPSLGWLTGSVESFELGSCSPKWTPFTLSGAAIRGGAIELDPGPLHVAAAAGRARSAVEGRDSTGLGDGRLPGPDSVIPAYQRMLYAGRFGFGDRHGSHLYLTGMYVHDDPASIRNAWYIGTADQYDDADPTSGPARVEARPADNFVGGAELDLSLLRGGVGLESELAGTVFTPDNRLPPVCPETGPDIYERVFRPNASTPAPDYSFRARPWVKLSGTSVYAEVERVGARHFSLGAPGLRTGLLTCGAGFKAGLSRNRVSVSASYEHEDNSPCEPGAGKTVLHSGSAGVGLDFPGMPHVRLGYSPHFLRSAASKEDRHKAWLGAGHRFRSGAVSHSPGLSATWQHSSSPDTGCTKADVTLSHGLGFGFPLSLAVSAGYGWLERQGDVRPFVRASAAPSCTVFRVWENTLTYSLSTETGSAEHTVGLRTVFPLWKLAKAKLSVRQRFYRGEGGSLHELQVGGGLSLTW